MKITKRKLRRIIKEELLREQAFHPMNPDHLRDVGADMSEDPAWQKALSHVGVRRLQDVQVLEQEFDAEFDDVAAGFQSMARIPQIGGGTMELGTLDGVPAALSSAFGDSMLITA